MELSSTSTLTKRNGLLSIKNNFKRYTLRFGMPLFLFVMFGSTFGYDGVRVRKLPI